MSEENREQIIQEKKESLPFLIHESVSSEENMLVVPLHWNEEIELLYFKKGRFQVQISLKEYQVEEECIFFVNPGELRRITALSEGAVEYSIRFNMETLQFQTEDEVTEKILRPLLEEWLCFPRRVSISDIGNAAIMELMTQVLSRFHKLGERYPSIRGSERLELCSAFDQLLLKAELLELIGLLDSYGFLKENKPQPVDKQVRVMKDSILYIRENYQNKIYVRDLAKRANLNEEYFIRFFKKVMGIPPMDYINRYRIQQAKRGLKETELKAYEVAEQCGFHNIGNFIKFFRKVVGMTPTAYRDFHRETEQSEVSEAED